MNAERYHAYVDHLTRGNRAGCAEILDSLLREDVPILDIYCNLFQRSMYEVGGRWERGEISVAVEHMATAITERLLAVLYPYIFHANHIGRSAIVSCCPGEFHQIGARMVADTFELAGWDGFFLGANTPESALFSMIAEKKPDILALSASLPNNLDTVFSLSRRVRAEFPRQAIIVGGQAFFGSERARFRQSEDVRHVSSLSELREMIASQ